MVAKTKPTHADLIHEARDFWSKVAVKNGWTMDGRKVNVWIDGRNGQMTDSLYMPDGAQYDLIVDSKGTVIAQY